jgi:hypothetical protein
VVAAGFEVAMAGASADTAEVSVATAVTVADSAAFMAAGSGSASVMADSGPVITAGMAVIHTIRTLTAAMDILIHTVATMEATVMAGPSLAAELWSAAGGGISAAAGAEDCVLS